MEKDSTAQQNPNEQYFTSKDIEENEAGITQCLSKTDYQIKAAIKYRYSDFVVNEISEDMRIMFPIKNAAIAEIDEGEDKILSLQKNENMQEQQTEKTQNQPLQAQQQQKYEPKEENREEVLQKRQERKVAKFISNMKILKPSQEEISKYCTLITPEISEKIETFTEEVQCGDINDKVIHFPCPQADKPQRTQLHSFLKKWLPPPYFSTATEFVNGVQCIVIKFSKKNKKVKRNEIFSKEEKFLEFTLTKENLDTFSALNILSYCLGKRPKSFGTAGTKDKRGVTSQRVSVYNVKIEELQNSNLAKRLYDKHQIELSDFKYSPNQIKLGMLYGNRFSIALRFISSSEENIQQKIELLKKHGFINYYGLQRFGQANIHTHQIGKALMQRNWLQAFNFIFFQYKDDKFFKLKTDFLNEMNYNQTLKRLPAKMKMERCLIEGLKRSNNNFMNAIMNIPKNMRELFPHGYQSYLWNRLASYRIAQYGSQEAVAGDIVFDNDQNIQNANPNQNQLDQSQKNEEQETLSIDESIIIEDDYLPYNMKIKVLSKSEALHYKITDVLIPIYGYAIDLPEEANVKHIIYQILQEDNIQPSDFEKSAKDFHLNGGYRKLIEKPQDVEWKVLHFNKPNKRLLTRYYNIEPDYTEAAETAHYKALALKLTLKKSTYATMCLRELMQMQTSNTAQNQFCQTLKFQL